MLFLIALNTLCDDWFGVLSIHLDVASFVLLYSNERANYLEHQDFVLLPVDF